MPALTSPQLTTWRSHPQWSHGYLWISQSPVIFRARVNQSSFTYPFWDIIYDTVTVGVYTDIKPEQTLVVRNGTTNAIKGFTRIRDVATNYFIRMSAMAQGIINFADNDILEVLDEHRPFIKPPKITDAGAQFKDYTLEYTDNKQLPKCNIGAWFIDFIDPDTLDITVPLSASNSYGVADGWGTLDYSWDIRDGTIVSGTLSSASLSVSFPEGERWVSCTVTDDFGFSHTMYKLVVGVLREDALRCEVTNLSGSIDGGWEAGFKLLESDVSVYLEGAPLIFWTEDHYGSTEDSLGGTADYEHIKFCGWMVRETTSVLVKNSDWDIVASNAIGIIRNLPAFSQTLINHTTITSWYQSPQLDWFKYVIYLLQWHSNLLAICDLVRPSFYADYPATGLDADAGTLLSQQEYAVKAVAACFTCDHHNRFFVERNPHFMSQSDLNARTISVTLADTDWEGEIGIEVQSQPSVAQVTGYAVVANDTAVMAVKSIAPGVVVGQGGGLEVLDRQLVVDQNELNTRTGRLYAYRNRKVQTVSMDIINQGIVVDPAWMELVVFSLASTTNRRGLTFTSQKFVPTSVSITYNFQDKSQGQQWGLEPIADFGAGTGITVQMPGDPPPDDPDESYVPSEGTWTDQNFQPPQYYVPFQPYVPSDVTNSQQTDFAVAWGDPSLYITDDGGETWTASDTVSGYYCISAIHSGNPDPSSDVVKLCALWTNGTDCLIRYNPDLFGVGTWTTVQDLPNYRGGILRHVAGVAGGGGFAAYLYAGTSWIETFDFTDDDGGWTASAYRPPDPQVVNGTYVPGVGWESISNGGQRLVILSPSISTTVIHSVSLYFARTNTNGGIPDGGQIYADWTHSFTPTETRLLFFNPTTSPSPQIWSGTHTCEENIAIHLVSSSGGNVLRITKIIIEGEGTNPFNLSPADGNVHVLFTDDSWATYSNDIANPLSGLDGVGGDCDDHNLGVLMAISDNGVAYTITYDQAAMTVLSGLSGLDGTTGVSFIRIPYYKPDLPTSLNNDKNNLRFLYGTVNAVGDSTIWLVTFNANTGLVKTETDITPIVGGETYAIRSTEALETAGANPQRILMVGIPEANDPDDGAGASLLYTADAGISWVKRNHALLTLDTITELARAFVRWNVGSLGQAWLPLTDPVNKILNTENAGVTFVDKTGDLAITELWGAYGFSTT